MKKYAQYFLQILLLAAIYFGTGKFGLNLDPVGGFAALIWLPTGISLAALLIFGFKLFPGIFLGAFLVNLVTGAPLPSALGIATGNTLEAIIAFQLLKKNNFHMTFDKLNDVITLIIFAAFGSTLVSATIGTFSLVFTNAIIFSQAAQTWTAWWVGDMLSVLIIVPTLLLIFNKIPHEIEQRKMPEIVLASLFICVAGIMVFLDFFEIFQIITPPITYLVFPPIIWIALRFSQRAVIVSILFISVIAMWGTIYGLGPFVRTQLNESLFLLQSFIAVVATTSMILSAVVTERKFLERQKDEFISVTSHELKTPLTIIKAYLQLLEKHFKHRKNTKSYEYISTVNMYVDKMTTMINDLLDVGKIESGKFTFEQEVFNIDTVLQQTIHDVQYTTTHIIIKKGKVNAQILGDKTRISQVFMNLLTNAIKYSPRAEKVIVRITKKNSHVLVVFQDYGIGIQKDFQNRVFERFFRATQKKKTHISGFGLGLYIAKEIIKQHGGEIWVESTKNHGSKFFVSLPIAKK